MSVELYYRCPETGAEHGTGILARDATLSLSRCRAKCPSCGHEHVLYDEAEAWWNPRNEPSGSTDPASS